MGFVAMVDLAPTNGRKSFYGKAKIQYHGGGADLYSYNERVCGIDNRGRFNRYWAGYSQTTQIHVNAFRQAAGLPRITRAEWERMPVTA